MKAYDFDGTIYDGDSSVDFYLFAILKRPVLARYLFVQLYGFVLYWLKLISKKRLKEYYFSFLKEADADGLIDEFWILSEKKIYKWYLMQKEWDDVVISASPKFLLQPICQKLDVKYLIASEVDMYSGKFLSENCYGAEKARRFKEYFEDVVIDEFYSDSKSDFPMTLIAKKSFLIVSGKPTPWI